MAPPEARGSRVVFGVVMILVVAALVMGWIVGRRRPAEGPEAREAHVAVVVPDLVDDPTTLPRISPDGKRLVVVVDDGGGRRLATRPLNDRTLTPLPGTAKATGPSWSPDGHHLVFHADDQLQRIDLRTGTVRTIARTTGVFTGASWSSTGLLLYSAGDAIFRVSAEGGDPTPVGDLGTATPGVMRVEPQFLPDGHRFVFFEASLDRSDAGLRLASIDAPNVSQKLWRSDTSATVGPGPFLVYGQACALEARRFDPDTAVGTGPPITIVDKVRCDGGPGRRPHSVSRNGVLLLRAAAADTLDVVLGWPTRLGNLDVSAP